MICLLWCSQVQKNIWYKNGIGVQIVLLVLVCVQRWADAVLDQVMVETYFSLNSLKCIATKLLETYFDKAFINVFWLNL